MQHYQLHSSSMKLQVNRQESWFPSSRALLHREVPGRDKSMLWQGRDIWMWREILTDPAMATDRSCCTLTGSVVSPETTEQAVGALSACGSKVKAAAVTAGLHLVPSNF